jgi:cytoskeleton protein RodZ
MSEGVVADGVTAGTLLRQAREAAGLHVATLAANLKVPVRKLEALEEDRYDLLPDAVFVRALASSVCRTLKMDPQPVLERLPQTAQPRLVPDHEGLNEPFRAPSDGPGPGLLDQVSKPVVLTVAVLLLGALVLVFQPMLQSGYQAVADANRSTDPVMPPPGAAPTVPGSPVVVENVPSGTSVPSLPAPASAPPATAAAPAPAAPSAAAPAVPAPAPVTAPAVTAAAPMAAPAQPSAAGPINARGIVTFRARAQSWIQVTDATGTTVFRKLMEPGESAGASGALPLSVTIGSVEATEVQVRGKPYNLAPVSKDNVARFEVK